MTGPRLFARGSRREQLRIADVLRSESVGGALLVGAAALALIWANSPWAQIYTDLGSLRVGPAWLHLDLTLATWAADGLLAIFFFVAGLELKREFVAGDLREPARAALPVAAAVGGMIVPALLYAAVNAGTDGLDGWAIPTATDIAFALSVLAIIGTSLPDALRTFLLTLAVVDDLLAITIIACFYTDDLAVVPLLLALVPLAAFTCSFVALGAIVLRTGHYTRNIASALRENHEEIKDMFAEKIKADPSAKEIGLLPFHDAIIEQVTETALRVLLEVLADPRTDELVSDMLRDNIDQIRQAVRDLKD